MSKRDREFTADGREIVLGKVWPARLCDNAGIQPYLVRKLESIAAASLAHGLIIKCAVTDHHRAGNAPRKLLKHQRQGRSGCYLFAAYAVNANIETVKITLRIYKRRPFPGYSRPGEGNEPYLADGASATISGFNINGDKIIRHAPISPAMREKRSITFEC